MLFQFIFWFSSGENKILIIWSTSFRWFITCNKAHDKKNVSVSVYCSWNYFKKIIPDKTPPKFNFCNESAVVSTDYSIHQISSSTLGYEYTDEPGGTPKLPESKYLICFLMLISVVTNVIWHVLFLRVINEIYVIRACNKSIPIVLTIHCISGRISKSKYYIFQHIRCIGV